MSDRLKQRKKIYKALAEFYFLDTEMDERDFEILLETMRASGWSSEKTKRIMVQAIAVHAGANLGYLFYPVIGEWAGFDEDDLYKKVSRSLALRRKKPDWYFTLSDKLSLWMLKQLNFQRLLTAMDTLHA